MTDWYDSWAEYHCAATGADGRTLDALLTNREIVTGNDWRAEEVELHEVTRQLVARGAVPKFANEHTDAIMTRLREMRGERNRAERQAVSDRYQQPADNRCADCGDTGWATVPHPRCVISRQLAFFPGTRKVYTAAVTCACPAGDREADQERRRVENAKPEDARRCPRRPTLWQYAASIEGADGPELLRAWQRETVERARREPTEGTLADLFPRLAARLAGIRDAP